MEQKIMEDLLLPGLNGGEIYLQKIRDVVSRHRGSHIALKKIEEYKFRIGAYSDTAYKDDPEEDWLEEWEEFYLSDHMFMEVIGVLEQFPCAEESFELILMVCEDGKVFAYKDDHLHLVANNLKELFDSGLQFPGIEQYYRGQRFKDMTEDKWNEVKSSQILLEEEKNHKEMVERMEKSNLPLCLPLFELSVKENKSYAEGEIDPPSNRNCLEQHWDKISAQGPPGLRDPSLLTKTC